MSSDVYKERLTTIRNQQKQMIKQDIAASGNTDWTVNNNKAKGRKMVNDMKKLLLRAFNNECDETIGKAEMTDGLEDDGEIGRIAQMLDAYMEARQDFMEENGLADD